jgi:uncharacterized RDD family membrane protein YckC
LIARMMAPLPADRFASYDELLHAITLASLARSRPAGFVVRCLAVGIDGAIASMIGGIGLALAYWLGGSESTNMGAEPIVAIAAAIYALGLARWGRTPGMALLELEVVAVADGGRPSAAQALVRSAVLFGVAGVGVLCDQLGALLDNPAIATATEILDVTAVVAPPLALLVASWLGANKRAPWDRVAGTMVRYRS